MHAVYWDANIFHALFGCESGRFEACMQIEKAARDGRVQIYTSTATFVECVWIKGHPDKLDPKHEEVIKRYFQHKYIVAINCDRTIAESARALIWKHPHLKPKDAIHVASAISQQLDVMHSYDNADLVRLDAQIGSPALKICNPQDDDRFKAAPQTGKLL